MVEYHPGRYCSLSTWPGLLPQGWCSTWSTTIIRKLGMDQNLAPLQVNITTRDVQFIWYLYFLGGWKLRAWNLILSLLKSHPFVMENPHVFLLITSADLVAEEREQKTTNHQPMFINYTYIYIYIHTYIHIYTHIHIHIHINIYIYMIIDMYVFKYPWLYTYIYIWLYIWQYIWL